MTYNNIYFFSVWNTLSKCFHFLGLEFGTIPTGINWTDMEALARLYGIKLGKSMLKRIMVAEEMTIKEYAARFGGK